MGERVDRLQQHMGVIGRVVDEGLGENSKGSARGDVLKAAAAATCGGRQESGLHAPSVDIVAMAACRINRKEIDRSCGVP